MFRLIALLAALLFLATPVRAATPSVAVGGWHSLALHADGSVRAWGDDSSGALGVGRSLVSASPLPVAGLSSIVAVAAGGNHTLALAGDGTVWAWGANEHGELGDGSTTARSLPVRVRGLSGVVQISAGRFYSVARTSDGRVWTWGSNYAGELGEEGGHRHTARPVSGLAGVVEVAAGPYHVLARLADATVVAWGLNGDGQLGNGTLSAAYEGRSTPAPVSGLRDVAQVAAGGWHSVALKTDGSVWTWGANDLGQAGTGVKGEARLVPVQAGLANVVEVSAGMYHSLARGAGGSVFAWGGGGYGQLGDNQHEDRPTPVELAGIDGALRLVAGFLHSLVVRRDGTLYAWGHNNNGQLGDGSFTTRTRPAPLAGVTGIAAASTGLYHTVALRSDGGVLTWGDNSQGQLGNGVFTFRASPQRIPALSSVTAIAAGYLHSLALTADGRVLGWGSNDSSQLTGEGIGRAVPAEIPGLANVAQVAAGAYHSLARLSDGTVRAFGSNYRGRLGNGNPEDVGPLSTVAGLTGVTQVSAGGGHSLALKGDGSVWAWGENEEGQLGDGSTTDRYAPVRVAGLADVVEVAAGPQHSLARMRDGSVWAWGRNSEGQLGDGTQERRTAPVRVRGLPPAGSLSAGRDISLAIVGGEVWAWGVNYSGGIGCPACDGRSAPIRIPGLAGIRAVAAFQYHVLALRDDGSLFAWGAGRLGQVGDGTLIDREAPVVVVREGGGGSVAANDWFLDLDPAAASSIPADKVPVFLLAANAAGADISADIRFRPQDVGAAGSVFVFALAPASQVRGAGQALEMKAKGSHGEPAVQCVLAQLAANGQLIGVNVANLQAAITGTLNAQGAAVSILNGVPASAVAGATFFVGYGASGSSMMNAGTNRGVVTVPGASVCKPEAPQTGWWWNPAEDGRGFSIEKRGNNLFFASFLYDVSGRSTWYVSSGPVSLDGSLYVGDLLAARGGQTLGGAYAGFPTLSSAGSMSLAFESATRGTLVWPGGAVPIRRFDIVPNGAAQGAAAGMPESGWWWNEQEPGRGFFMEWQGATLDIAGYMYDDAGNPVWYLTVGDMSADGRSFSGRWWSYGNGQTLTGAWKPNARLSDNVAPVTVTFSGADAAAMTLPNGRTTSLKRHRF